MNDRRDKTGSESRVTLAPTGARETLAALRLAARPTAPFPDQATWTRRLNRILPELPDLSPLRIAVLGNGTLSHFAETLRFWLALEGFRADIHLAPYGAFRQQILDPASHLYAFQPEIIWLFPTVRDVSLTVDQGADALSCGAAVDTSLAEWRALWRQLRANASVLIVQNNLEAPGARVFGHYDGAVHWSRASLVRRFNLALTEACADDGVFMFDLDHAAASFGVSLWHEARHWHQSKQPFAPDAFGLVAFQAARYLGAMKGTAKKCLVLDLDNTLWGGVIGDDGLAGISLGHDPEGEAFVAFQDYLNSLVRRGILLAVCSKNEDTVAREPFRAHPEMRLREEDIVVFLANWNSKVDNLREIARRLNIGLDALVFVDDNPAERDLVRSHIPEIAVPDMPADPAEYIETLASGRYFESTSLSEADSARTRLYVENAQREAAQSGATDVSSFLRELGMTAECGPADAFRLPRMSQLLARTNQFHPTTTRHTQTELAALASDPHAWVRWFSLRDRFGDHGLVSVVVLLRQGDAMIIDTWAMSCRVFSRGLEDLAFLQMTEAAQKAGAKYLVGHYYPTPKNRPVADLFARLGFVANESKNEVARWVFDLTDPIRVVAPFIRLHKEASGK